MKRPFTYHPGIGYRAFDRGVLAMEASLLKAVTSFLGYNKVAVAKRLIQRTVELSLNPFLARFSSEFEGGEDVANNFDGRWVECQGIKINGQTGELSISFFLAVRSRMEFLFFWFYILWIHLQALLIKPTEPGKATLVFGVGKEAFSGSKSKSRFVTYCSEGPIKPLADASRIIIQSTEGEQASLFVSNIKYARYPLFSLVKTNAINFGGFVRFIVSHSIAFTSYFYASMKFSPMAILARDFAFHAMTSELNEKNLIEAVVLTNSNYTAQPLWMNELTCRRYSTHMVWYSMNLIPLQYKKDSLKWPVPTYRYIQIDEHWVWSDYYADYLRGIGLGGHANVVGPVLWYLPVKKRIVSTSDEIRIAVFDVTPVTADVEAKVGLTNCYYSFDVLRRFIENILDVAGSLETKMGRPVRVLLKTKREYNAGHDKRYIDLLTRLNDDNCLELVPHYENIYSLLEDCAFSITIPNSSPPLVATHIQRKAFYYDPTAELEPNHQPDSNIFYASGFESLESQIYSLFKV